LRDGARDTVEATRLRCLGTVPPGPCAPIRRLDRIVGGRLVGMTAADVKGSPGETPETPKLPCSSDALAPKDK